MKYKVTGKQNNSSRCIVCGDQNKLSLNTRFYELENGELAAMFRTEDWHQSYPGRTHGGMAAAILDETIGRSICLMEPDTWAVTVELNIQYKKPVPTESNLRAVARVTKNNRKLFEGTGEILLADGTVAASAWGKYMKMPSEKLTGDNFVKEEWYLLEEDDPKEIELVE